MQSFSLSQILPEDRKDVPEYLEFLREDSMNGGIYRLPAGKPDPQEPHRQDELYYVIEGAGNFDCDGEDRQVRAGSILFVEREVPHRFHSITEDLVILVVFAGQKAG